MFRATAGRKPPHEVGIAFRLAFLAVLLDVGGWVLDTFVIPPTGFQELRSTMGWAGAIQQTVLSAGFVAVLGAGLLWCAFWMCQGRSWARLLLIAVAALHLLFVLTDMNMSGLDWTVVHRYVPDLCIAAIGALLVLPPSHAYFSTARQTG
ncbi:hypothetical protein [Streptomyces sp. NPDC020742]|uniref:hypothetical protein n=1 Tax=Streptomyces sp. NPDC020742 TaxID=3154897 RepID=UPI003408A288